MKDFKTQREYVTYVTGHLTPGLKVRCKVSSLGFSKGETGTVVTEVWKKYDYDWVTLRADNTKAKVDVPCSGVEILNDTTDCVIS